jgi:polyisoprenyl-phosphate glycosyltransferase
MSQSLKIRFCIVIPCYNEAANIPLILERFRTAASRDDVRLLLVDNGSSDESAAVLARELEKYDFARSIRVPVNQGYGYGILEGLKNANAEFIGWTHADMQTDPRDIFKAADIVEAKGFARNIYVKGERRGRPLFDSCFTTGMSLFESIYLGSSLWDINAQPNIFHRSFFESWKAPPFDFALDLYSYYIASKGGLNLVRFDVQFPERVHGQSTWNRGFRSKIGFIKRTLSYSFKLKRSLSNR